MFSWMRCALNVVGTYGIASLDQILCGIVIGQRKELVKTQVRSARGFDDDLVHENVGQEREDGRGLLWVRLWEGVLHL